MTKLKKRAARKGAKMTVRHTLRGAASKTRRKPVRAGSLLSLGALIGAGVTWAAVTRGRGRRPATT